MLVKKSISCVPILDKDGTVLNVFEAVDVIALLKGGDYESNLNLTVGKALEKRSDVSLILASRQRKHPTSNKLCRTSPASTPARSTIASIPSLTQSASLAFTA